jgi:malonyl-CoA O-methyltransferase
MALSWRRWLGIETTLRLPAREGYAVWADTYPPRPHNRLMAAEQEIVEPIIRLISPTRALDVGTGTGRYLSVLRSAGARYVVGLDMSLPMLEHRQCATPRVCGDACKLPFADGQFDLVCSSLMVGDVADLKPWIAEATRVLAPGGHLVYSDFHPSWASQQWRRTFRAADGKEFELAYFPHAIDEHLARLEQAALEVRAIREPRIAGRATPVVAVFHATKHASAPARRPVAAARTGEPPFEPRPTLAGQDIFQMRAGALPSRSGER